MRYTKQAYTNVVNGDLVCKPLAGNKGILTDECDSTYNQDGKCKECDYRAEAYQRVRRNDTQFTIGCNRLTKFMEKKKVNGCPDCPNNECDNCDNCDNNPERKPSRRYTGCVSKDHLEKYNRKRIQKTVMLSSSEYLMNKSALNVSTPIITDVTSNSQASDRKEAAENITNIRTRNSNSLRKTRLSVKPGALAPGGKGVDVKHNSYERYLAKKKGRNALRGKDEKQGVISGCDCVEK